MYGTTMVNEKSQSINMSNGSSKKSLTIDISIAPEQKNYFLTPID
jgi:hypothetical protein